MRRIVASLAAVALLLGACGEGSVFTTGGSTTTGIGDTTTTRPGGDDGDPTTTSTTATSTTTTTSTTTSTSTTTTTTTAPPGGLDPEWAQATVRAFAALQSDEIPEHLGYEGDAALTGAEFDVAEYFTVLDHLAMEPGWVLDYVYQLDGLGGAPRLYARPEDQPRYLTFEEWYTADRDDNPFPHIVVDDTPEGYFQLVLLRVTGSQFYLWWHALYDDTIVFGSRDPLERILDNVASSSAGFMEPEAMAAARAVDPTPVVVLEDGHALVVIHTWTKWGGLHRTAWRVSRSFPHEMSRQSHEQLAPYDCGMVF
jgi:hypothetical protein